MAEDVKKKDRDVPAPPGGGDPLASGESTRHDSESPGRDRLVSALKRPRSRGQLVAAALLAIVGFASVVQVQSNEADTEYEGARQEDLVQLLNSLAAASQRTESEIGQLERTRTSLRNDTDKRRTVLEQARQQATVLGILGGTLPAVGPGVVVTVEDPNGAVGTDQLLNGLEELRAAGVEAIEINDSVRVVAQTSLADGENGVLVDGEQLSPPYTIEAIGDPHTVSEALEITGGFVDVIEGQAVEGNIAIKESSNVEISTLYEPEKPEYAEPVQPE